MAKQTIVTYPAVAKDSGSGTPLADAFKMVNDNFDELYAKPDLNLVTNTLTLTKPDGTTDTVDLAPYLDGDITAIIAGDGLTGGATDGDATLNVVGGDGITANDDEIEVSVDDSTIELSATDGSGVVRIKDDGVTYDKMGAEFTTAAVISASDVDFSSAAVFTKTISGTTTLTFSNVETGMVKDLVITGTGTLTLPASVKTITGTYDGTVSNLIQIVSTNGSTEQWATISQEA